MMRLRNRVKKDESITEQNKINKLDEDNYGALDMMLFTNCRKYAINSQTGQNEPASLSLPDNRYQCDICKYGIEGYRAYLFHLKLDEGEPPYACSDCGKQLKTARSYELHLGTAHKEELLSTIKEKMLPIVNDPNNYCQSCEDTYSNKNNLEHI
ncbi:hypothetical protein [Parasitella parasitica]|uniref:C2H2-type domain-containing protein n=1 Tax=Parasitella parasitica TaxID=35722 RepID=A0A0B7N8E9_9FUNG|nr:hypothetical protein [Parasitella parasitica]